MSALLASYENGGTHVSVFSDGTKRREIRNPDIAPVLPEQMDLKITDWCDAGCAWCHEGSTRRGTHGEVQPMLDLLHPLPRGAEIAIGGGDPLSHPDFEALVAGMKDMGLIPSVTVNGRHLARHKTRIEAMVAKGHLYGLGVSYHEQFPTWKYKHLVDHMIAGVDDPRVLMSAAPRKVLILGYKDWGRGMKFRAARSGAIDERIALWFRMLPLLARKHHLSFDTLAIEQMQPQRLFHEQSSFDARFMGDEGQYSLYVDGVSQTYAISSYAPGRWAWTDIADMFKKVRNS